MRATRAGILALSFGFLHLQPAQAQSPAPGASSADLYGDRQQGHFGDVGAGYFGNPSAGDFTRYNFSRTQEGSVPLAPATPRPPSVSNPPYVTLKRAADGRPGPATPAAPESTPMTPAPR
jgi:hypothetical protein